MLTRCERWLCVVFTQFCFFDQCYFFFDATFGGPRKLLVQSVNFNVDRVQKDKST